MLRFFVFSLPVYMCIQSSQAHKIGNSAWCLHYTIIHLECVYDQKQNCEQTLFNIRKFLQQSAKTPNKAPLSFDGSPLAEPFCSESLETPKL
jgi:hypothetical protein